MGDNCGSSGNYLVFLQAGNQVGFPINKGDNLTSLGQSAKVFWEEKGIHKSELINNCFKTEQNGLICAIFIVRISNGYIGCRSSDSRCHRFVC